MHRLFHTRFLYSKFHKVHHSHLNPVAIGNLNFHWFEALIGTSPTFFAAPLILGKSMHSFTILIWALYLSYESIEAHCGYELPWSPFRIIPFAASATYHNYHHSH
jgi:sterol desaturase/sphingolipid hydroxylase (fatty acid hydroxylase superfamily)